MDIVTMKRVIYTLNTIEVKGKENLTSLLGCIETLEGMVETAELNALEADRQEVENGG